MKTIIIIYLLYFVSLGTFYLSVVYSKNILLAYYNFKKIFNLKYPRLAAIKIGYYYTKKIDNHYYANLIASMCKKHLNIQINPGEVMSDLYSSTKFGPVYYYRNIMGFIGRSMLFSLIKKIHWGSGLFIYLNRNHNIGVDLNEYRCDSDILKSILDWMHLSDELSILNIIEFVFIICTILSLFEIFLKLWTISDRRVSIYNKGSNLLSKLSSGQKFYFRLGVFMFSLFSRWQILGQLIFGYLILCQLQLISFIKINVIFEFIDYILDNIFKLCGFKIKETYSFNNKLEKWYELIHKYLPGFIKIEQFKFFQNIAIPLGFGWYIYISIQIWPFQVTFKFKE